MERSDRIRRLERVVQLVASALMAGVATLGGVAYYLVRSEIWTPIDEALGAVIIYAGMGVMAVGLLIAPMVGTRLRGSLSHLPEHEIVQRYAASIIVPQAVREGVGIVGVMTGMLSGSAIWILIFAAASVGSQAVSFPRSGDLEERLRRGSGAGD